MKETVLIALITLAYCLSQYLAYDTHLDYRDCVSTNTFSTCELIYKQSHGRIIYEAIRE